MLIAITILLYFDPVFAPQNKLLLLLLPFAWGSMAGNIPSFRPDFTVVTPKNFLLFLWFNKLVIIPLELLWAGNTLPVETFTNQDISTEILITLVSFGAFAVGWALFPQKQPIRIGPPLPALKKWAGAYLIVALSSLVWLYDSFDHYFERAIFTYTTREIVEKNGTFLGFLANIGQRFWVFGVLFVWYKWKIKKGKFRWLRKIFWLLLCLAGTLSSNRSNMVFPILTLMSVLYAGWKTRYSFGLALFFSALFLFSFFFGYVRVQPSLDAEMLEILFNDFLERREYILQAHQLYIGSPYQITPLLSIQSPSFTLIASLLEPIPILGKAFREQSGPYIYNLAYHQSLVSQDKVIPMAGELYYNGGYLLEGLGYSVFGIVFRWLDTAFKSIVPVNLPLAAAIFSIMLLFSATLLLSLTVLMQFMVYNTLPALLVITANWPRIRKAS
ncbi:hypothetical protein [Runella slithyformis]|uniref:Oligosaccharide repeat unit polymerase n=1 Tax=Runella slithyformis (strain ATCC 29530 / DSM 19594 / LMG 11500 / NCIMB 11436 / LSU 4) TaxID=761193 RepID=A0A7U3ZI04_RUNSL|nr:hypothetical protein [Runella slithyformis]AEI47512.1 hypothetical protein Runsl_1081 [Runella slithyformis DSM 19594]